METMRSRDHERLLHCDNCDNDPEQSCQHNTFIPPLLFLELDLNLNKKCQFPVIIPLFTVHVQGNKNLNTIETLDSKYKTFCEGFINVTGNSH